MRVLGLEPGASIDPDRPLSELGLDSIMAVELRNALGADLALERPLPATLLFDRPSIASVADYIAREVLGLDGPPGRDEQRDEDAAALIDLSEDQAEALLVEELSTIEKGG